MHQSTLQLKLRVLTLGKVLPHYGALRYPTLSQMSSGLVLARIVTASVWTEDTWKQWCDGREKADLPLQRDRSEEVKKVSDWVSKKPAGRNGLKRKRTVFTVERPIKSDDRASSEVQSAWPEAISMPDRPAFGAKVALRSCWSTFGLM